MMRVARRIAIALAAVIGVALFAAAVYAASVALSVRTGVARTGGTVGGLALQAPVRVLRDERGIAHIRAANVHDLFFAQGYATGSDRLFQIDITRRFVLGRLAEVLGPPLIDVDMTSREVDVRSIAHVQFGKLGAPTQALLQAYADGVNAAAAREPLPPEYRTLLFGFEPWRAEDALVVGFATVLDLADGAKDVLARDAVMRTAGAGAAQAYFSLTDPAYDAPTVDGPHARIAALPPLRRGVARAPAGRWNGDFVRDGAGSNEWVAGAAHTTTGRALLANDPHLSRAIPGIWHLVDLRAPGFHAAGATLAGTPGVILGHNEHVAWGSTNGTVAAVRVFAERFATADGDTYARADGATATAAARTEVFHVRFGGDRTRRYLTTVHGFVVEPGGALRHAVQWDAAEHPASPVSAFLGLDRAASLEEAWHALAAYPGPTQNFVLADVSGRAAYTVAGGIPDDPAWGLRAYDGARAAAAPLHDIPFARLPHLDASRDLVAINSNNLQYGAGYPYRLSANYSPPYRAAEIRRRLRALPRYGPSDFSAIQADTMSVADLEFAHRCAAALERTGAARERNFAAAYAALRSFDGRFDPGSHGATVVQRVRGAAAENLFARHLPPDAYYGYLAYGPAVVTLMRAVREHPPGWFANDDVDRFLSEAVRSAVARYGVAEIAASYGDAYTVTARHPLAAFGLHAWDAAPVPGSGGSYAPAVQGPKLGQSFRAVWDVGAWDRGGIDIPNGESGEPGSEHYRDLAPNYARHAVTPLPFSDRAVEAAARATLVLRP
ncbi:MAG: penicillin acylase family protein [Candidatus Velthaea sp.]